MKTRSLTITLILFPFILLLAILRMINFLKSNIYDYLIILMCLVFLWYFIVSLFYASSDILNGKKINFVFLLLFSIFYLPIYFVKEVYNKEKYLSYILFWLNIILFGIFCVFLRERIIYRIVEMEKEKIVLKTKYNYVDKNNLFTIMVDNQYTCYDDLGEYSVACENKHDDSFLGIYSYETSGFDDEELANILLFHINQSISYIEDNGYDYEVEELDNIVKIKYNDMVVLQKMENYIIGDSNYSLIIVKEVYDYDGNIQEFQNFIESIIFL